MDEIGFENTEKIIALRHEAEKWAFLFAIASTYGFTGIHITPSLYASLGLSVEAIPSDAGAFHLSYHLGGLYRILTAEDCAKFEALLDRSFAIVERHKMKDISLHPPVIEGFTSAEKGKSGDLFAKILRKWSTSAKEQGFTLSLETHLYEPYFLFGTLAQYKAFYHEQADMGILIDISHNYFSGYSEQEIVDTFSGDRVAALHISDAIQRPDQNVKLGTHLPIGEGHVDFQKMLPHYNNPGMFAVLEIKSTNAQLQDSLNRLRRIAPFLAFPRPKLYNDPIPRCIQGMEVFCMPLLKYRCTACGAVFDTLVSLSKTDQVRCEACGGAVERAYQGACLFGMAGSAAGRGAGCSGNCASCAGCGGAHQHAGGCACGACHG
ncbi:MAG: TIM barrel protein [Oscillospiraceae bacterium]|nr:TIM barrel protein [Oscillospiraceae bacterium]